MHKTLAALAGAIGLILATLTPSTASAQATRPNAEDLVRATCPEIADWAIANHRSSVDVEVKNLRWMGSRNQIPQALQNFTCQQDEITVIQGTSDGGTDWNEVNQFCLDARRAHATGATRWGYASKGTNTAGQGAALWCVPQGNTLLRWSEYRDNEAVQNGRIDAVEARVDNIEAGNSGSNVEASAGLQLTILPGQFTTDLAVEVGWYPGGRRLGLTGSAFAGRPTDQVGTGSYVYNVGASVASSYRLEHVRFQGGLIRSQEQAPDGWAQYQLTGLTAGARWRPAKAQHLEVAGDILAGRVSPDGEVFYTGFGLTGGLRWAF